MSESSAVLKTWVIVKEPGKVPQNKSPLTQTADGVDKLLHELIACRPKGTRYTVARLTWNQDLWVDDGHEELVISEYARPRGPRKRVLQKINASR